MTDTPRYSVEALELGPMENFVYLVHDHASNTAAVVDPAWNVPEILAAADRHGARITDILLTHSHNDHVNGVEELLRTHDAELHLLKPEAEFWGQELAKPSLHHGGDRIKLGDTEIEILHTPGHTPGSACYKVEADLLTGDTLFVFGCGRCDMAGGDPELMFNTLRHLKSDLPAHTCIHPGHNYSVKPTSTIGDEAEGNPFMHFDQVSDFVHYRMHEHDKVRDSPYAAVTR